MKSNSIVKIYEDLDFKQQAELTFKFLNEGKFDEATKVFDSVSVGLYECIEQKFMRHLMGLMQVQDQWGLMWWQAYGKYVSALFLFHIFMRKKDVPNATKMIESSDIWASKIGALNITLERLAEKFGLNAEAIKKILNASDCTFILRPVDPDMEYQAETEEVLSSLVTDNK